MKYSEAKQILARAAAQFIPEQEAQYFATEIVEAHVRKSPRSDVIDEALGDIESWVRPHGEWQRTVDLPGYFVCDGCGLGPLLKIKSIHDELASKAHANGLAMMSIRNAKAFHTLHVWVQGLANRGYFALAAYNGGPDGVIPLNGTVGILGTNPIAFGFPGDKGSICIDMATSEIPYFHVLDAKKRGAALPQNSAVDSSGELTTDATTAVDDAGVSNLTPMGNTYKGYNLNYVLEIMTSALIGAKISAQQDPSYLPEEHGGFIIAIDIERISGREQFDQAVHMQNDEIRAQKPRAGVQKVLVPGDTNLARVANTSEVTELLLSEETLAKLQALKSGTA